MCVLLLFGYNTPAVTLIRFDCESVSSLLGCFVVFMRRKNVQYTSQMDPGFSSRNSIALVFCFRRVLRSLNESFQSSSHTRSTLLFHSHQLIPLGVKLWHLMWCHVSFCVFINCIMIIYCTCNKVGFHGYT